MDQFNFDAQLGTSPLMNELVKRLVLYESNLTEIKQTLDEVNRKVDTLLAQSTVNNAQEFGNAVASNQNLIRNGWGLGGEFVPFYSSVSSMQYRPILTVIASGRAIEPRKSLFFNTQCVSRQRGRVVARRSL